MDPKSCGDVFDRLLGDGAPDDDETTPLRLRELEESALREIDMIATGKTRHFPDEVLAFFAHQSVREIGEILEIDHDLARMVQEGASETLAMRREVREETVRGRMRREAAHA